MRLLDRLMPDRRRNGHERPVAVPLRAESADDRKGAGTGSPDAARTSLSDRKRNPTGTTLLAVNAICFTMTLFQLYISGPGNLVGNISRAIHLGYGMALVFLLYPVFRRDRRDRIPAYDIVLAVAGIAVNLYIVFNFRELTSRAGLMTKADLYFGILMILLLLECARRVVGPVLTGIAIFFILYTLFGRYFPPIIAHRGASLNNLVRHMYLTLEGVYGTALGVSANFIFLFILMGSILTHMGTGELMTDLALLAFGKQRGGPAKAAVLSSAMFGLISGSSVANICTTGTFTIPLMKKTGYRAFFAGSVEAAASVGGQLMPPVMGAAAFIIAENLGIPYLSVCIAAAFPALLYFSGIFFAVHQEAVRMGIRGLSVEDLPSGRDVARRLYLLLPLGVIVFMMAIGFSPSYAGLVSILVAIALSWFDPSARLTPRRLFIAFADGAKNALEVLIACAVVGFIVGSFTLSGMGLKLASLVVQLGNGSLLVTLVFTAVASLILGMGVPTTANYVMMAMITVPALTTMGVLPIAAHLFCFYFGIVSDLTPPVALGSLAGAGIAGAGFWPTAVNATKLAIAAFLAPFFFVYNPLLLLGQVPFQPGHLFALAFALAGLFILSCGLYGFILVKTTWYERILLLALGLFMIWPEIVSSLVSSGLFIVILLVQMNRRKRALAT